jgi:hypothetical protein
VEKLDLTPLTHGENEKFTFLLTLSGAFPILFFTVMNIIHQDNALWYKILIYYIAVILSFLGGIHWGLAISLKSKFSILVRYLLAISIIPVLIAWIVLLIPTHSIQLDIFILAFVWVLFVDFFLEKNEVISKVFFKTRVIMSVLVVCILIAARLFVNGF